MQEELDRFFGETLGRANQSAMDLLIGNEQLFNKANLPRLKKLFEEHEKQGSGQQQEKHARKILNWIKNSEVSWVKKLADFGRYKELGDLIEILIDENSPVITQQDIAQIEGTHPGTFTSIARVSACTPLIHTYINDIINCLQGRQLALFWSVVKPQNTDEFPSSVIYSTNYPIIREAARAGDLDTLIKHLMYLRDKSVTFKEIEEKILALLEVIIIL